MSYGHGDPSIPSGAQAAHDRATQLDRATYRDPATGYAVFTAPALANKAQCCGIGCRHCPYSRQEQAQAKRAILRPRTTP